jgi:hypothetical protein
MTNTHEGLTKWGPFYTCMACGCRAAIRGAIRAEDWQTVKFLTENAVREHAADCEAPRGPMFEVIG